jgi:hypothetical protein
MKVRRHIDTTLLCILFVSQFAVADEVQSSEPADTTIVISNAPESGLAQVGTRGLAGFDESRPYKIVLDPTLDRHSSTGVRIPSNMREAILELKRGLPASYLTKLRSRLSADQSGIPIVVCESDDPDIDLLVDDWMIVYWDMRKDRTRLVKFFKHELGIKSFLAFPFEIRAYLCRELGR